MGRWLAPARKTNGTAYCGHDSGKDPTLAVSVQEIVAFVFVFVFVFVFGIVFAFVLVFVFLFGRRAGEHDLAALDIDGGHCIFLYMYLYLYF